jgi:5-methylcytosine-specific restriction endonuclease McrA
MSNRYISKKTKLELLNRQNQKCANNPNDPISSFTSYKCLLWKYQDGSFDLSGYEVDHIIERSLCNNNNINNLQLLCPNCHSYKTKMFKTNKKIFHGYEIMKGACLMDTEDSQ